MENNLVSLIDSTSSILVVLPEKPNFDQVAAGLSLYLSIHERKDISIFCPTPMMVGFSRLIGVNKISGELSKKNLSIRFTNYEASNIDKVGYDIENGEFKLTVTPKAGFLSPQKDQVFMDYTGTAADLVILIGGANDSHFPIISTSDLNKSKIVHIGTRVLETNHEVLSFAKPSATVSELVAGLIRENGLAIDPDVATNLVLGIEEGSGRFIGPDVIPETFETFAFLLRSGGQRVPGVKLSPADFPPGAIPEKPFGSVSVKPQEPITPVEQVESQPGNQAAEVSTEVPNANPPSDWLQPKIFKGTPASQNQPTSFGESKS